MMHPVEKSRDSVWESPLLFTCTPVGNATLVVVNMLTVY